MVIDNYWLLAMFGIVCIVLSYLFGFIVGYKKSEDETTKWIDRMTEEHRKEREKSIDDMYSEQLARELKMKDTDNDYEKMELG